MEKEIIEKRLAPKLKRGGYPSAYLAAKTLYNIDGMPEPHVEINIYDQAESKMNYLRTYNAHERINIRKFVPYFEEFDAEIYFSIFNREFFRVIEQKPNH
ncbi:MAG: hypothetical protein K8R53_05980 [Bacteroidales bacterium]|nr:hypothetical protein [Bacteroidales bacterium]